MPQEVQGQPLYLEDRGEEAGGGQVLDTTDKGNVNDRAGNYKCFLPFGTGERMRCTGHEEQMLRRSLELL